MNKFSMELVTDLKHMLEILKDSLASGKAVGIYAPTLGREIFVTAVEDIHMNGDPLVILKSYDVTGYILGTNKLRLSEIKSVCPFKSSFPNPYMKKYKNQ